jgi:hypothetical protein
MRDGEPVCPVHDDAEVTKFGLLYKCDNGHTLTAPETDRKKDKGPSKKRDRR